MFVDTRLLATLAMRKRIILLLDGTWNDADFGLSDTNIVRLRELISISLTGTLSPKPLRPKGPELRPGQRIAAGRMSDDAVENLVFYERGVGTNAFDRFRGGTFGDGLERNVRRAYRFLSFYYTRGDEVFVFGFSREHTQHVPSSDISQRRDCFADSAARPSWKILLGGSTVRRRTTACPERGPISPPMFKIGSLSIDCLGLFDTVGALGVPLNLFRRVNRQRYEFHNVDLSSITKVNLHALAVDEHRVPFQASVWRRSKFKELSSITEQVWFSGAHADVGGGYYTDGQRVDYRIKLDDISLDWMLKRVNSHFPGFPLHLREHWKVIADSEVTAEHTIPVAISIAHFHTRFARLAIIPAMQYVESLSKKFVLIATPNR